jgi:PadR family transcriptional regulator PadR
MPDMVEAPDTASRETLLMRGVLDMCVLALLDVEPLHAYGLMQRLRAHGFANASYGTMYPLVTRLRKQGLVDQQLEVSPSGPARNVLQINPEGRAALKAWADQWQMTTANAMSLLEICGTKPKAHAHGS